MERCERVSEALDVGEQPVQDRVKFVAHLLDGTVAVRDSKA